MLSGPGHEVLCNEVLGLHGEHLYEVEGGCEGGCIDLEVRDPLSISLEVEDEGREGCVEAGEEFPLFRRRGGGEVSGHSAELLTNHNPEHLEEPGKVDMEKGRVEDVEVELEVGEEGGEGLGVKPRSMLESDKGLFKGLPYFGSDSIRNPAYNPPQLLLDLDHDQSQDLTHPVLFLGEEVRGVGELLLELEEAQVKLELLRDVHEGLLDELDIVHGRAEAFRDVEPVEGVKIALGVDLEPLESGVEDRDVDHDLEDEVCDL